MRRSDFLALLFFFLTCLFPGLCLLSGLFDYTLLVNNPIPYVILTTLCCYGVGAFLLTQKDRTLEKLPAVLLSLCPLLSQINVLFILFYTEDLIAVLLQGSWLLITIPLVDRSARSTGLKISFYVLAGLLAIPILLMLPWIGFGSRTVLAAQVSPGSIYAAEVIDSNEGALGGATQLLVYRNDKSFSLGPFSFRKDQKEIYSGPWGEFETLSWIDGEKLSLNGRTFDIAAYYFEGSSEKERIIRYVETHESLLLSCIEQNDFSPVEKDAILQEIRIWENCIDFRCGGAGFGPETSYWGFYYSEKYNMTAVSGPLPAGQLFQKSGSGYLWKESWYDPNGDNSYYAEQIGEHFYYYEMSF